MFLVCSLLALALAELKISGKGLLNKILLLLLSGVGFVLCVFFHRRRKDTEQGNGRTFFLSTFQRGVVICTKAKDFCREKRVYSIIFKGDIVP